MQHLNVNEFESNGLTVSSYKLKDIQDLKKLVTCHESKILVPSQWFGVTELSRDFTFSKLYLIYHHNDSVRYISDRLCRL